MSAILNTMHRANELDCTSLSIPAISSGIFGFPKDLCAEIFFKSLVFFVRTVKNTDNKFNLKLVRLTNFDTETTEIFKAEFDKVFGKN